MDGERDHVRIIVRGSQTHAVALVAAGGVVVIDVPVQDGAQVPLAGDEDLVGALAAHWSRRRPPWGGVARIREQVPHSDGATRSEGGGRPGD